ncbi:hypothetical protein Tam1G_0695 [Bifidobacterium imperatoris]|nr:hypothetical protein Tam1G_0695 [Bifidobacterium imperatoris]
MGDRLLEYARFVLAHMRERRTTSNGTERYYSQIPHTAANVLQHMAKTAADPRGDNLRNYSDKRGKHQRTCWYYASNENTIKALWGVTPDDEKMYRGRWQALQRAYGILVKHGLIARASRASPGHQTTFDLLPLVSTYLEMHKVIDELDSWSNQQNDMPTKSA